MLKRNLIFCAGIVSLSAGIMLSTSGSKLIWNSDEWLIYAFLGLFLGCLKSRFVFLKSANKNLHRIDNLREREPFYKVYSPPFYAIIGLMICLGMILRYFGVDPVIRGIINIAVGTGLLYSSFLYLTAFRSRACN